MGTRTGPAWRGDLQGAHIEDADVVVNEVFHHLHLVLAFAVGLEEAGCEEQRQVLGGHLVEVCAFLHPGAGSEAVRGWPRSGGAVGPATLFYPKTSLFLPSSPDHQDWELPAAQFLFPGLPAAVPPCAESEVGIYFLSPFLGTG